MGSMIGFYNSEVKRFNVNYREQTTKNRTPLVDEFIDTNPTKISWTHNIKQDLARNKLLVFNSNCITTSLYRPFTKQALYFNRRLNERVYQMPQIFPEGDKTENLVIQVNANYKNNGFIAIISDVLPDLHCNGDSQCFPLYLYDKAEDDEIEVGDTSDLFAEKPKQANKSGYTRKDGITDEGLQHFQNAYPDEQISKKDIFYYVYGLLHSQDYRQRYAANLNKELPRIPCVKTVSNFWRFSQAGRDLAELHINYETVAPFNVTVDTGKRQQNELTDKDYYVTKMKHPKVKDGRGKSINDLSTVIYNHAITLRDIPAEAYDYVVNGKPAIEWVIERQCVKTDKKSGIVNNANDWATETMNNPKYPLELLQRVITVSLETNKIVATLPQLNID